MEGGRGGEGWVSRSLGEDGEAREGEAREAWMSQTFVLLEAIF